jgi:hypothetical protein
VHFTSDDPKAILPADYTFTAADGGKHAFSATMITAGQHGLKVTDTATGIWVNYTRTTNPAAASAAAVAGYPSPTTAGSAHTFTVTLYDAYGNVATGYTGTLHVTSSDVLAVLPADYTFTSKDAGKHTFTATLNTKGTQSITATDTATSSLTGTQSGIQVQ